MAARGFRTQPFLFAVIFRKIVPTLSNYIMQKNIHFLMFQEKINGIFWVLFTVTEIKHKNNVMVSLC